MPMHLRSFHFCGTESHSSEQKIRHSKISSLCSPSPIGIEIIFPTAPILVHIVTPPNCDRDRLLLNSFGMENSPQDLPHPPTSLSSQSSISATSILSESSPGTTINSAAITHPNATINDESDFSKVRISDDEWNVRLQDPGCTKDALASNTYRRSHIPGIGPLGMEVYYYHLTSIAVDYLKLFTEENTLKRGWAKVPKNKSDAKVKIVGVILALRKEDEEGNFVLEQTRILQMLSNMWGASKPVNTLHYNDRVRVYGIIMAIPANRHIYQRLAEGCTTRRHLDDPVFNLKQMFQNVALQFNDERLIVELPPDYYAMDDCSCIDANDINRIRITRDCE